MPRVVFKADSVSVRSHRICDCITILQCAIGGEVKVLSTISIPVYQEKRPLLTTFIYEKPMKDGEWPGWGSGILGDCGSLDPGSIPGPGPSPLTILPELDTAVRTLGIGLRNWLPTVRALVRHPVGMSDSRSVPEVRRSPLGAVELYGRSVSDHLCEL